MSDTHVTPSTARSAELYDLAAGSIAGGVGSGTRSHRSGYLPVPVFVRSGQGAHITDEDGNDFIDYVMGQGPLILGHRPPAVIDAVTETLRERGSLFSLAHDLEGQTAAAVTARMPSIDLLRFGQSGTECVQYAIRFARSFTGREKILRFEGHYHGWSDAIHWSGHPGPAEWGPADAPAPAPGSAGMPPAVASTLIIGTWNDADALERIFAEHGSEIAAIITEPIMGNMGALRRPGHADRDGHPAQLRLGLPRAEPVPARRREGEAAGSERRGDGGAGADLDDERRPGAEGGPVPGGRAQLDRPQGDRGAHHRRLGLLGTPCSRRRPIPRSPSTTSTRTTRRARTSSILS
jgi:hypothetical protein